MKPTAILDCDPGHDDAMAILLAARTLNLQGITTVHGNVGLEKTTRNALRILTLASIENIPVAAGMDRPLLRHLAHASQVHGESGLDGPTLPEPALAPSGEHAVDFINRIAHECDGLHLVPVGPLTNIAVALQRFPDLAPRITQITLMGGSLTSGNVTAAAEFNIWADPEAAHIVFNSSVPIKMVGLNVTRQVAATPAIRQQIRRLGTHTATVVADLLDFYSDRLYRLLGLPGGSMHDPLAVAALAAPDILQFEPMHVTVELRGEHTYGMTLCDARRYDAAQVWQEAQEAGTDHGGEIAIQQMGEIPNAQVAVGVNGDAFWELFLNVLASYA